MKATIDLQSDERLRKEIRAMIEGQVKSLLRNEVAELVANAVSQDKKKFTPERLESIMTQVAKDKVSGFASHVTSYDGTSMAFVEALVRKEVYQAVEDKAVFIEVATLKAVASIQKERLDQMIEKVVEKKVKSVLAGLLKQD